MTIKITSPEPQFTEPQAKDLAVAILEEEANQLAGILDTKPDRTHREIIAISYEIRRLRAIARSLKP